MADDGSYTGAQGPDYFFFWGRIICRLFNIAKINSTSNIAIAIVFS